ncbi:uncharacterized protein EV422DRAFT_570129 [Fimicolochytrium jonesii]|uniref:uncharacterized protein n=1 Tax=Fimicolochytrium jonesii TaxID=1396493 RepID=UPI0022FDBA88|nr:uncharacterized protein EV422DRAFT_570129 [Fimicolochytrium jonesii]KAI8817979.1 hypothetical protein EV422DRAFT_570129 [Fimicolochytrium jonesii]
MKAGDPTNTPRYDAHRGFMMSLWMVPFILGGVYAAALLGHFLADLGYHSFQDAKDAIRQFKHLASRGAGRGAAEGGVAGESGTRFGEDTTGTGSASQPGYHAVPTSVTSGSAATLPEETGDTEGEEPRYMNLRKRFERAAKAARTTFLLSLIIATVGSIPIEYACTTSRDALPGMPPIRECHTCLTNAASLPMVILSWVFLAMSAMWVLLDLSLSHVSSLEGVSVLMDLLAEPLVLAALIIALRRWSALRSRSC